MVCALLAGLSIRALPALAQPQNNAQLSHEPIVALDWQPLNLVPPDQRDDNCKLCQGRYIDPLAGEVINPDAPVNASASGGTSDGAVLELSGAAVLEKGGRRLTANDMTYDREGQRVEARGDIVMREPGFVIKGERASYNMANGTASIEQAHFTLHEEGVTGSAARLDRDDTTSLRIQQGALTYCPPTTLSGTSPVTR